MVDNKERIKQMLTEKAMTLDEVSGEVSLSHRKAKQIIHSIQNIKFISQDNRKFYSLSEESLEKVDATQIKNNQAVFSKIPFLLDHIPWNKNAMIAYIIIILALSVFLKSDLTAFPVGDERLYAAAGIQAVNGKIFIVEHPPISYLIFGVSTYFMPLDYSGVLELPSNWYYGISNPAIVEVLRQALPGMRIVPIIFSFLLAGVMFYYSNRLYGKRAALLVFFMASLSINMLLYSTVLMMEIMMLFFGTTTILFYVLDYMPNRTQKNGLILFILMSLTLGTRSLQPFIIFSIVVIAEILRIIKLRKIDPVILVSLGSSFIALFMFYPYEHFTFALNQFTVVSKFGQNMLVPLLSKVTLLVLFFIPIALFKYLSHITGDKNVKSAYHVLFLAAIITGGYALMIGKFRYAVIALPFFFMVMPYSFKQSGAAIKNFALVLVAVALVSSFYYFPYFDSFNNPVSKIIGVTHSEEPREIFSPAYSYLKENYNNEQIWTDSFVIMYSGIPMTSFFDYDVALNLNGVVITEGKYHQHCTDSETLRDHIDEIGYDIFFETDRSMVEGKCPGLVGILNESPVMYEDEWAVIYSIK